MINVKYKKIKIYFMIIILLLFGIGIGYSYIYTDLSIDNDIVLKKFESDILYDNMMLNSSPDNVSSTYVTDGTGINFANVGSDTNGKGIYMVSSSANYPYPIYYYRGAVDNNHVKFANFCWKIVRTTETGGIKILYNGSPLADGSCANSENASQIGTSKFNDFTLGSVADVGYKYGTRYETNNQSMVGKKYVYGNSITYNPSTNKYQLVDATSTLGWSLNYSKIRDKYHYTCMSTNTSCDTVYYMYFVGAAKAYYIPLSNGQTLDKLLKEMTTESSNTTPSIAMNAVENWYANHMTAYTDKLEDTVWCSDRNIYTLNGWDENISGKEPTKNLCFMADSRTWTSFSPSYQCTNPNDRFTVSKENGAGGLNYPVGLLTVDEIVYGSGGKDSFLYSGATYWLMTPGFYEEDAAHVYYYDHVAGIIATATSVSSEYGIRPAVSLKRGTKFVSGDGTVSNPYVIE